MTKSESKANRLRKLPGVAPGPTPGSLRSRFASASVPGQPPDTVRLSAEGLDRLLRSSAQLLTEGLRQDRLGRELEQLTREIDELDREGTGVRRSSAARLHRLA